MKRILGLLWLTAGAVFAQHSVDLSWPASVTDATHSAPATYNVKRASVSGGPYVLVPGGSVNATQTIFTDVASAGNPMADGQKFFYVITAQNSFGESGPSTEVAVTLPGFPPSVPGKPTAVSH